MRDKISTPGPRRGRPPRISRQQIIEAARGIPPQELTMQAVAAALGVDRKALHRYVGDRDGLVELVVADMFESEHRHLKLPVDADWQDMLNAYGTALRDGVVKLGAIGTHIQLSGGTESVMLPWAERVLQALVDAGFTVDEAGSILTFTSGVAISAAHDAARAAEAKAHPHVPEVARALRNRDADEFPMLSQVLAARQIETPFERDFDFDFRVITLGLERILAQKT